MLNGDNLKSILDEPFWSLADTLAWVAFRDLRAISHARSNANAEWTIEAWLNIDEVELAAARSVLEAWQLLSSAMSEGLSAFGTKHSLHWSNGIDHQQPGAVFPPKESPGAAWDYRPEHRDGQLRLVPDNPKGALAQWQEWDALRFRSKDVRSWFPASGGEQVERAQPAPHRPQHGLNISQTATAQAAVVIHLHNWLPSENATRMADLSPSRQGQTSSAEPEWASAEAEPLPSKGLKDEAGAEAYLKQLAEAYLNERGPRLKHREWLTFAKDRFGISNNVAAAIYRGMPEGFRQAPGRPRSNQTDTMKRENAS